MAPIFRKSAPASTVDGSRSFVCYANLSRLQADASLTTATDPIKGESMRKLIVASAFAALMASAPAMAASPGGSVGGGAAARGGISSLASPLRAAQVVLPVRQVRLAQ